MLKSTKTEKNYEYKLSGKDIVSLLTRNKKFSEGEIIQSITVRVPGGGDWSHMNLDIDEDCPVVIKTKQTIHENS